MVLTKAQTALTKEMSQIINLVGKPLADDDRQNLINILKGNQHQSLWGLAIRRVFDKGGDVDKLIEQLADQAMDQPFVMYCIVGMDAMLLLLRSVPQ